ncbi:uncharacterized protein TRAVEDRAFT_80679, partial [Trametes versicolor FP-101664 SS1]|uniref:uncharacterized protein n=1 Tax=Trametes versicolor (strain FP-101664) TaxID=717944 RepID=UPI00046232B7
STLRPHCWAAERILKWTPSTSRRQRDKLGRPVSLSDDEIERISTVTCAAWQESTRSTYGTGLLVFHVYCDLRDIPDEQRAPAPELLILSFITSLAGSYSDSAINNYVAGVRAWHIIHGLPWTVDKLRYDKAIAGAGQLAPETSKRSQREPVTVNILLMIKSHLDITQSADAAIWACMCVAFYSLARLGELVV